METLTVRAQWPSKSMEKQSRHKKKSGWSDRGSCQHDKFCVFHEGHLSLWRSLLWPVSFLRRNVAFLYFRRSCD